MKPAAPWQKSRPAPSPGPGPSASAPTVRLPPWHCAAPLRWWRECSSTYGLGGRVPFDALALPDAPEGSPIAASCCPPGAADALELDRDGMAAELAEVEAQARYALDRGEWDLYVQLAAGYPEVQRIAARRENCPLCKGDMPGSPPEPWRPDREICPAHRLEIWLIHRVEVPGPQTPESVTSTTMQGPVPGIGTTDQLHLW